MANNNRKTIPETLILECSPFVNDFVSVLSALGFNDVFIAQYFHDIIDALYIRDTARDELFSVIAKTVEKSKDILLPQLIQYFHNESICFGVRILQYLDTIGIYVGEPLCLPYRFYSLINSAIVLKRRDF